MSADVNVRRWENISSDAEVHFLNEDSPRNVLSAVDTNGVKKLKKQHSRKSFNAILNNKNKRFHTNPTTREREWRYTQQKLLQEIEKLVTKSQKEMTSIANEDLNEISKVLKNRKTVAPNKNEIEVQKNPQAVFIIKRKRKIFPHQKCKKIQSNEIKI